MAFQFVLTEVIDNIGIITISHPKVNALSSTVVKELSNAFDLFEIDESVRVIIISGAGDRYFVAGADIKEFTEKTPKQGRELVRNIQLVFNKIEQSPKPVIAAINGYCLGGGLELAMACDVRFASENAFLGQAEINIGIIPGGGGTQRLPRLIGKGKAKELILSGNPITAKEALEIQLIQKMTPPDALLEETMKLAKTIAQKSPYILFLAKEAIDKGYDISLESGLVIEADKFGLAFASEDKDEGVNAFLEKREPKFVGK